MGSAAPIPTSVQACPKFNDSECLLHFYAVLHAIFYITSGSVTEKSALNKNSVLERAIEGGKGLIS